MDTKFNADEMNVTKATYARLNWITKKLICIKIDSELFQKQLTFN